MVPVSHVLAYAVVVSVLIAIPGPSVLFTISRALTVGRRAALLTVAGNEMGLYLQVIAVAFGAGAVVERSAHVLTAVKLAGAAYLVYLGVQAIRHRASMADALAAQLRPVTVPRAIRDGFVVGAANPKTIVFCPESPNPSGHARKLPNLFDKPPIRTPVGRETRGVKGDPGTDGGGGIRAWAGKPAHAPTVQRNPRTASHRNLEARPGGRYCSALNTLSSITLTFR